MTVAASMWRRWPACDSQTWNGSSNAFGSEAVECVSEALDLHLRAVHGQGTRRFSPGYGDLSIVENAAVLARLGVDFVLAHPETGILKPRKSTVFLIGWLPVGTGWNERNKE